MSASNKKKLRKEQVAAQMTERQLHEKKEAKKLKIYTAAFSTVLVLLVVLALVLGVSKFIASNGIFEKNTVALTVGEHEISNAELNYYFITEVNNWYSQYGSYASIFGLDLSLPLDEQVINEENGYTWADDFMTAAKSAAQANYAMVDAANAAGYTLGEDEIAAIDSEISTMSLYASIYGYSSTDSYLKAMYGNGADEDGYRHYLETAALANAYYNYYADSLTYEDSELQAKDDEDPTLYNSYSYNSYYIAASKFYEGGTTNEDGTTTYSAEEKAQAAAKAEEVAKGLAEGGYTTVMELDDAIAALEMNAESETEVKSDSYEDTLGSKVSTHLIEWLSDDARVAGEIACLPSTSTSTDADGKEVTTVNGYYVVMFHGVKDNTYALANVRHILITPEGGTYNSTTGLYDYSEEEMTDAKPEAEALLEQFLAGEKTAEAFGALANEHSADGDGTTGGLYEDVVPGTMVENFDAWCFAEERQPGDTGIVESIYGWHIMYYVGDSETSYRDYMISNTLMAEEIEAWSTALYDAVTVTEGDTKYIATDLILANG